MNPLLNNGIQFLIPVFVAAPLAMSLLIQLLARGRPVLFAWLAEPLAFFVNHRVI